MVNVDILVLNHQFLATLKGTIGDLDSEHKQGMVGLTGRLNLNTQAAKAIDLILVTSQLFLARNRYLMMGAKKYPLTLLD